MLAAANKASMHCKEDVRNLYKIHELSRSLKSPVRNSLVSMGLSGKLKLELEIQASRLALATLPPQWRQQRRLYQPRIRDRYSTPRSRAPASPSSSATIGNLDQPNSPSVSATPIRGPSAWNRNRGAEPIPARNPRHASTKSPEKTAQHSVIVMIGSPIAAPSGGISTLISSKKWTHPMRFV